jgi:hypothetical protein
MQYWVKDFLQVAPSATSYYHTDVQWVCANYLSATNQEKFEVRKRDPNRSSNRSTDYFKTKEAFKMEMYFAEVSHHPEMIETFTEYKGKLMKLPRK